MPFLGGFGAEKGEMTIKYFNMTNQDINKLEAIENKPLHHFTFTLTCPKCQSLLTPQDFDQNHFTVAHLQSYFQSKETEYKQQLLGQMAKEIETFPLFQQLKS